MYISSTQPVNHLDALPILLDHVLGGGDVTLVDAGDGGRRLLDLAAGCLGGLRSRVLWAAEALPGIPGVPGGVPGPSPRPAGASKASVADDAALSRGFRTLTVLDPTCERIVLLVGDAHALQHATLRYIQFVSRCGGHLQLVFCGVGNFLELLEPEEFAWLRARLAAGLVMTLAAPTAKASSLPPGLPAAAARPAARAGETAVPLPGARRPAASAGLSSRLLRLDALAVLGLAALGLAVLGLGGAAWLAFDMRNGEADRPAAGRQAATVVQPPADPPPSATPRPPAVSAPATPAPGGLASGGLAPGGPAPGGPAPGGLASHADSEANPAAPGAPASPPVMAGEVRGAGPGSPSGMSVAASTAASGALVAGGPQAKAGVAGSEPDQLRPPQPPTIAQPPAVLKAGTQGPGTQALDGPAAHAGSGTSPAAPDAPASPPPVTASRPPGAGPRLPSGMPTPPPVAASYAPVAVWPRTKAGVSGSESNRQPQPGMAPSPGRQGVAAPSRAAAAAPGSRAHKPAVPADDRRLALQPAAGSPEPPGSGSPQYIGSYATDASGVRVFHLEP